jgi:uncharacterized membrane protein YecN with MAPEG domain
MDETNPAGKAAALWAGLHLLVLLVLSGLVVRERRRHGVVIGDAGVPELLRAQRAFGNAVEYVSPGLGALAVLAVAGAPAAVVHVIGGCLFLGRVVHGVALSLSASSSIGRTLGMVLTWTALIAAAVALLLYGL